MSEPAKRYYRTFSDNMALQSENASLKAEVKRLRALVFVAAEFVEDYERLRKAGDAMAVLIKYEPGVNTFDPIPQVVKNWNAAKEGKQS